MAASKQRRERLAVALGAVGLHDRALVPVELQPAQRVEDLLDVLRRRALAVGVLDAQHELPALVAGEQPVEQGRAGAADVQGPGGGWREANPHNLARMLIGAHVSPAGGLPKAIERGQERGCRAIQIFNQSPRMWRPTAYPEEDFAAFREAMAASPDRRRADPRRLPAQLRQRGRGHPREIARLADALAARRRRRSGRPAWCCTPARPRRATRPRRSPGPARRSPRRWPRARAASCTWRTPPAPAARSGARCEELAELLEAAGGERAARRVPGLLPPAGLGL